MLQTEKMKGEARMNRQRKVVMMAMILAGILVMVLIIAAIYKYVAPSNEKRDLKTLFELGEGESALILDNQLLEGRAMIQDGELYVPADMAGKMDQRIYVDTKEAVLSYATSAGVIQVKPDAVSYAIGKENKQAEKPILLRKDNVFYISLSFIGEHTSCYYKEYQNPSRLVVMADRTKKYTFGVLNSDTRVRTGPGKKYAYLVEVPEGRRVFVETGKKQENEYMAVTTEDGITGYIPVDRIDSPEEATWQFEKTPESFEQKGLGRTICLGWHQMTSNISSMPDSLAMAECMNVLSPTWFALSDNQGNFTSLANTEYVNQAHANGLQVWGLVNDFGKKLKLSQILGVTSTRTKLINSLVGTAIQYDLDGINIDFENVTKDNAPAYLQFLRELTLKAHVNDLVISVDNYVPADYNTFYDLEEQGRIVDYVIMMGYDEHYPGGGESGSVSSLGFVEKGVKDMTAKVPKERVVAALPFFTRLWKEEKTKSKVKVTSPSAYGMSSAESLLKSNDTTPEWDEETGQYYGQYKADGATYKIWLEEETSLKKKLEVVNKQEVAGVAFWKLGFERATTWTTIQGELK